MRKIFFLFISFCFFSGTFFAQTKNNEKQEFINLFQRAEEYYVNENYDMALNLYLKLDTMDKNNANISFKIGVCYLSMPQNKTKAISFLELATKASTPDYREGNHKERFAPPLALNYLARAYHLNYQFDKAIETYKKTTYFLNPELDKKNIADVKRQIEMCKNGKEFVSAPVNLKIQNLGPTINSEYADYSPLVSADESLIYFTSKRKGGISDKLNDDDEYNEDIYTATRKDSLNWNISQNIGEPINTLNDDASVGISVDGQRLLVYRSDLKNGGDIFSTELVGKQWSIPQKLNDNVNSAAWEPSASIASDVTMLYFTSDRSGGYGGRDIYRSKRLPNGQWAKPINLGPVINTAYDEDAPFIHADGSTLFFSSTGHKSMGGFDIFFAALTDSGTWTTPQNMGHPLNTPDDDIFYIPSADNRRGYYASVKEGGYGDKDIYMVTFPDVREKPLAVYKGNIKGFFENDIPEGVQITVTDNANQELIGIYYPNSKTGKYLFILPPGKNYNISYEAAGFLFHSENLHIPDSANYFVVNNAVELTPIKVGQKITLKNIFFDVNKATIRAESKTELEKLKELLTRNSKLIVEISGHTDGQGKPEDNLKLSQKRAESVKTYLIENGIAEKRMKAVGYGDSQPLTNDKNPDGTPNQDAMQINRRTELKMIGLEGGK